MQKGTNFIFSIFAILFFANLLAWIAVFELAKPQYLEVTFFDVGQGDSIFIETPQRHQILIDGGPDATVLEKLGKEMPFWDRTIDLVVLTHPEYDHIAGLLEILKRYKVENVLWTGVVRDTAEYEEWLELLQKEEVHIFIASVLQKVTCYTCPIQEWELDILFPFQRLAGEETKRTNNTSVVAKIVSGQPPRQGLPRHDSGQAGQVSFLLTGDIEKSVERQLVDSGLDLDSDILKVAHHGSKTSTAPEFVAAVSPDIAVISAGRDNRYGHPHTQTIETLRKYTENILRTDINGDIKFITDGKVLGF